MKYFFMDGCPKDKRTAKNLICKNSSSHFREKLGKLDAPFKFFVLVGVAGSEDFVCATLPTTPLDFQGKIKNLQQTIIVC